LTGNCQRPAGNWNQPGGAQNMEQVRTGFECQVYSGAMRPTSRREHWRILSQSYPTNDQQVCRRATGPRFFVEVASHVQLSLVRAESRRRLSGGYRWLLPWRQAWHARFSVQSSATGFLVDGGLDHEYQHQYHQRSALQLPAQLLAMEASWRSDANGHAGRS